MPTATARYGRPKGSGLDDSQQLKTIAALLAANPNLKPTTAIRQLGVVNPSVIRRLRDKFRHDQATLMANAHRAARPNTIRLVSATASARTPTPQPAQSRALVPIPASASQHQEVSPAAELLSEWCDLSFAMLSAAAQVQAVLAECWLRTPLVAVSVRRQLAINSTAVGIYTRGKTRRRDLH
jgi:hypothetical protein